MKVFPQQLNRGPTLWEAPAHGVGPGTESEGGSAQSSSIYLSLLHTVNTAWNTLLHIPDAVTSPPRWTGLPVTVSRNNCSVRYFVTAVRKVTSAVTKHNNFPMTENVFLSSPLPSASPFLSMMSLYTSSKLAWSGLSSTSQLLGLQAHTATNACTEIKVSDTSFKWSKYEGRKSRAQRLLPVCSGSDSSR